MNNENKKKDNNKIYIAVFTTILVIAVIIGLLVKSCSNGSQNDNSKSQTAAPVSVVSTEGSQDKTINKKIKIIRNVKYGKSHKAIEKAEKKNADTLSGSYQAADDGTAAYLTYKFNTKKAPEFFGAKVVPTDNNSLIQYVFDKDDKMYEIRLQYGKLSKDVYDSIISNITGTYGNATFSRTFSHGSVENWWKTDKVTLTAYYQETGVSVYLRKH